MHTFYKENNPRTKGLVKASIQMKMKYFHVTLFGLNQRHQIATTYQVKGLLLKQFRKINEIRVVPSK